MRMRFVGLGLLGLVALGAPRNAAAGPPTSAAPAAATVTGKVVKTKGSIVSESYVMTWVRFENAGPRSCEVSSYRLAWDKGGQKFDGKFTVEPGKPVEKKVKLGGAVVQDVDLEHAQVEITATCK
jgi:hypothetical protein